MENTYKLIWSDEALKGLKEIIEYLENKFPEKEVKKFAKKLDKQLDLIKKSPESNPRSKHSNKIRRTVIAKLTSIYYIIDINEIKLISIVDNRKDPKKIKL